MRSWSSSRQLAPLLLVALEVDLERAPLRVLPAPVERLRVVELDLGLSHEAGTRARMIAEAACSWTRWVSLDLDRLEAGRRPARLELGRGSARRRCSRSTAAMSAPRRLVHVRVGDDVADGEAPTGPQDPRRLAEDLRLVAGEVDHAVGDDHVDRVVGQRDVLDRALDELDVLDPGLALVARAPARASRRSCRGRRPCRPGRPGGPRAGRRSRRPSRGRGRSRPRAARPPRSGCRSRATASWAASGRASRSSAS